MTAPDESKPVADDVDRFIATIDTFVRNVDVTSQSNPYRVTLRKLWHKAAELDANTVIKALYLLHTILRNAAPEDSVIFKTLLSKMSREQCKKTKCKYFDAQQLSDVSSETEHLQDFIERYSTYVLKRARTFTSEFEEMKLIDEGMRTEDICAQVRTYVRNYCTLLPCSLHSTLLPSGFTLIFILTLTYSNCRSTNLRS
jgi:hypothetical protein